MAQLVKNLPAIQETWVRSLGWEDPLEKEMATHSSILAWRTPWATVHGVEKNQTGLSSFHFQNVCYTRVHSSVFGETVSKLVLSVTG